MIHVQETHQWQSAKTPSLCIWWENHHQSVFSQSTLTVATGKLLLLCHPKGKEISLSSVWTPYDMTIRSFTYSALWVTHYQRWEKKKINQTKPNR